MQLISFDQERIPTSSPANEQWKQTLALEKAQDEIVLLREQIDSLQQYLSEQLRQQQEVEQELRETNQELELINAEILQLVKAKQLFLEEVMKFTKALPTDGKTNREELTRLFSKFYDESVFFEELELAGRL